MLLFNLLALLVAAGGLRTLNQGQEAGLGFLVFMAMVIGVLALWPLLSSSSGVC